MPREVFVAGQVLTAAELNVVSDQSVMVFAGTAARGSAIPSPSEGMVTYRSDDDVVEVFDGSVFAPVGVEPAILQVVTATNQTEFSTTSNTFQATGLSATITPSSTSSKVLVMVSNSVKATNSSAACVSTIFRGTTSGTNLGNGNSGMGEIYSGGDARSIVAPSILDAPSTSSAQTYTFAIRASNGGHVQEAQQSNALATMTLMEVAG